jgi:hypothetical protein
MRALALLALLAGALAACQRGRRHQGKPRVEAGGVRAELRDVVVTRHPFHGEDSFLGELHNTGSAPIDSPAGRLTLGLLTAQCTFRGIVEPGEKVPCDLRFVPAIPRHAGPIEAEVLPLRVARGRRPALRLLDARLHPKLGDGRPSVTGHVRNDSGRDLYPVYVIASVYGDDGKIVGAESTLVDANEGAPPSREHTDSYGVLRAGQVGAFRAVIERQAATPVTFSVVATGPAK